jgi:drug/metabolite transporter (DMT)-like permease
MERWVDGPSEDAPMTRRGLLLFVSMAIIWGIPYLFIRVAVAEISPPVLVFLRTLIATAILLPVALLRIDLRAVLVHWRWVAAFAAIEIAIPWVLLGSAEQRLSSSLTGLLIASTPLIGTVFAVATGGTDRLGRTGVMGLLVGLAGVLAIVGGDFATTDALAVVQVLLVAVCYAIGPAILARRLGGVPSLGIMALSLAGSALLYAPVAVVQWPAAPLSTNVIVSVVVLGTICTAAAFILFAALIGEIGPVRATVITYINPAVAAILGVAVLQETFTAAMGVGLALVILGSALATRRPHAIEVAPDPAAAAIATVPEPATEPG